MLQRNIFYCLAAIAAVAVMVISTGLMSNTVDIHSAQQSVRQVYETFQSTRSIEPESIYTIVWLHPIFAVDNWLTSEEKLLPGFESCEYKNCNITYSYKSSAAIRGDAVVFPGRQVGPKFLFERPLGQVWIFFELESPEMMDDFGGHWRGDPWKRQFNWTMTYDSPDTDIPYTYGEIRLKPTQPDRNYTAIAMNKTGEVLIVNSHCSTPSKRETYIAELSKHISVKVLGDCGDKWKCGRRYVHNDCFQILNQYRYYLAFENSLCDMYITEKLFNNFEYDTVLITRGGGKQGDVKSVLPEGTYISTDEFDSVKALGDHLKNLSSSVTEYAEILKRKDRYYNVGFAAMYKRAMCDVCKRMNKQDEYRQTIPDMGKRWFDKKPCRKPDDIN